MPVLGMRSHAAVVRHDAGYRILGRAEGCAVGPLAVAMSRDTAERLATRVLDTWHERVDESEFASREDKVMMLREAMVEEFERLEFGRVAAVVGGVE